MTPLPELTSRTNSVVVPRELLEWAVELLGSYDLMGTGPAPSKAEQKRHDNKVSRLCAILKGE